MNFGKIILDLCGGTGSWSKPYKDAGYAVIVVTLPDNNVIDYIPPKEVYGILAAPPCTMFSLARTNAKERRDLKQGMEIVIACLNIIWNCQYDLKTDGDRKSPIRFWALENPDGMLRFFLGMPALTFQPYEYGDRYQKKTCLWGNFNNPKKNPIELTAAEKERFTTHSQNLMTPSLYNPMFNPDGYVIPAKTEKRTVQRSITPPGFAQAFFETNR